MKSLFKDTGGASRTNKSISLTVASLCSTLSNTALSMVMARLLPLVELAVYRQTLLAYQTFVPILGLGISQGIYYVFSRNEHRKRAALLESVIILTTMGLIYALFIACGGRQFLSMRVSNEAVATTLLWMVPLAILSNPASLRPSVFVYQDRVKSNTWFTIISHIVCVLTVLVSVVLFQTGEAAVASHSIGYCIAYALGLYFSFKLIPNDNSRISFNSMKAILAVSVPLGVSTMLGTISNNLDNWIVSFSSTPEVYAVFSYGSHELPFVSTIASAISTVVAVDMVKYTKEGNYDSALELFKKVGRITSCIIFPIMMLFLVIAEPFYEVLYSSKMLSAVPVFRVYLLALPIRCVVYGPLLIALGKSKSVLTRTIIVLVSNLGMSLLLVRYIGPIGASIATILSMYIVAVPVNLYMISKSVNRKWTEVLPFAHFGKCLLISGIPAIGCCILLNAFNGLSSITKGLIIGCIYMAIVIPVMYFTFRNELAPIIKRFLRIRK